MATNKVIDISQLPISDISQMQEFLGYDENGNLIKSEYTDLTPEVDGIKSDINLIQKTANSAKSDVDTIKSKVSKNENDIDSLDNRVSTLENKEYATEKWVKDQDYATNSDVDEFVGDRVGQVQSQIYAKQDKLVSGQNIKTINGKSILGNGDIVIEGGAGGADSYVLLYPQHYSIEITNEVDWTTEWEEHPYEGSERQAHNKEVIQKLIAGEVKSLYLQIMREEWYEYLDEYTYRVVPVWMYVPVAFRNDNVVDPYDRVTGVISKDEESTDEVYVIGWRTDANANNIGYFEQQIAGGSGGGYDSDPTFESLTVNGFATFNSEIVMAGGGQTGDSDIASMISCAFKAGKTQSIDQWTRNIHCGTDGQGLRVCSSDEDGETQYMAVDTDGNIYEGTTKLSDKYATKDEIGNINNILETI